MNLSIELGEVLVSNYSSTPTNFYLVNDYTTAGLIIFCGVLLLFFATLEFFTVKNKSFGVVEIETKTAFYIANLLILMLTTVFGFILLLFANLLFRLSPAALIVVAGTLLGIILIKETLWYVFFMRGK